MNSTITIGDTDEEVIDLDSSQDATNDGYNDESERSVNDVSLSDNVDNNGDTTCDNVEGNENIPMPLTCEIASTPIPLVKVMFRDENVSRQYRKRIKDFLEELISLKTKGVEEEDNSCNLTLEIWDSDVHSKSDQIDIATESEDSQDLICDTLFTVDTQPKLKDDLDVPTYGKKYKEAYEHGNKEPQPEEKEDCAPKLTCFNCMDNHALRDCKKPRNHAAINKNRKNFNSKSSSRTVRYHLDNDLRFGHMIPGQLSKNLRKAMGLKDNELPTHIYRMRILGYPPGWLEEARLQHSGISLFNSDGVPEEDHDEPGEIFDVGDKDQYDTKKIFDFPGFNVPPPPRTYDGDGQYWASHVQSIHSKETMLLMLRGKKADEGYKRKKLKRFNNPSKDSPTPEPSEMEIEDTEESVVETVSVNGLFIPPLPQETCVQPPEPPPTLQLPPPPPPPPLPPPPPASPSVAPPPPASPSVAPPPPASPSVAPPPASPSAAPSSQVISEDSDYHSQELQFPESPRNSISPPSRINSPSLSDLENMKKQLLVELQDSNSQSNSDSLTKNPPLSSTPKSEMLPPSNEVTPDSTRSRSVRNTLNTSQGSVKSVNLGTPVLQSTSPYNKLPSSENFSKNICDVINFENLPDSTGKYKQMTGVLQKVRDTLAQLHQE